MLCARGAGIAAIALRDFCTCLETVTASEAKQSIFCWVLWIASSQELLAMTARYLIHGGADYSPSGSVAASSQTFVASSTCGRTSRRTRA